MSGHPRFRPVAVALLAVACLLAASCSSGSGSGSKAAGSGSSAASDGGSTTGTAAAPVPAKASPGCSAPAASPATLEERRTLDVAGAQREYLLTLPDAPADEPLPLVIDIHGLAEGMQIHAQESQFGRLAQKDGFAVVQPNGTGTPIMWDISTDLATNKDLQFIRDLVHTMATEHCIDETRVYATGLSMGAFMSSTLACALSDRIAAVAPVAGVQLPSPCDQSRKVPILAFHGTEDPILHFNGGIGYDRLAGVLPAGQTPPSTGPSTTTAPPDVNGPGYPETIRRWAAKYGCGKDPKVTREADHVSLRAYPCPAGTAVEFAVVDGGGHSWPGSQFDTSIASIVGPTNQEIDATQQIWRFFQRFQVANPPAL